MTQLTSFACTIYPFTQVCTSDCLDVMGPGMSDVYSFEDRNGSVLVAIPQDRADIENPRPGPPIPDADHPFRCVYPPSFLTYFLDTASNSSAEICDCKPGGAAEFRCISR